MGVRKYTDEELLAELQRFRAHSSRVSVIAAQIPVITWRDVHKTRVMKGLCADELAGFFGISRATLYRLEEEGRPLSKAQAAGYIYLRQVIRAEEDSVRSAPLVQTHPATAEAASAMQ